MIYKDINTDVDCRYRYIFWNMIEKVHDYYGFFFLNILIKAYTYT